MAKVCLFACRTSYTAIGQDPVSAAVQTVDYVNIAVFTILALAAVQQWRKGGGRPALWAALAFGAIGIVFLAGLVLPENPEGFWEQTVTRIDIALLVLFPYLLYKFTTAFERAPSGLERFVGLMTAVVVVWTFALPRFPQEDEEWSVGFKAWLIAFLFHWSVLSIIAAVRLWRAGRGQPSVAQRRMRFLAAAAALLTAALLLAGLGAEEASAVSLVIGILATMSGIGFILGVAPPAILRLLWRRPDTARMQQAIAGLMRAETPEEVTQGVLPPMLGLVGARAVELRDASGQIVGSYRPQNGRDDEEVEVLDLALPEGSLSVWTSRHAPFFGEEELARLRTLGSLTELALDRARLFSHEQASRRALEEADELKMNFIALAAHELRTPVAIIHGVIETLERRVNELEASQRSDLEQMLRIQATALKSLVEQLLDLSRLDAHAVAIEPARIPVRERVKEIVSVTAGSRVGEVEVEVPAGLEAVVDPDAFDRIISNLVTNALRYGRAPIRVTAERENGRLQVAVEDRGEGVPSEFVPRLFERFSRSDPSRRRAGGTGLGLAIAHSYAEAHSGELRYREARPHGARFELLLPGAV
jgi:signal transduction histidine kinase